MRKFTISAFALAITCLGVQAQSVTQIDATNAARQVNDGTQIMKTEKVIRHDAPEVPIWSEDFANGLPTGWTNQGYDVTITTTNTNSLWTYRGPNTTPNITNGSVGAYSGVNSAPKSNNPIASPTASNGFMIFDSDFLDNGGTINGIGTSPSPHAGVLTTPTINLASNNCVELSFYQYYRKFAGPSDPANGVAATYIQFSTDGGLTWGTKIEINKAIWVNYSTPVDDMFSMNVSQYIGGAANAKIRFIFSGDYYFWMIDDVEINIAPDNQIIFTPAAGAPKYDQVNADTTFGGKYGYLPKHVASDETRPFSFDANVFNQGCTAQTNVKLTVDVLDQNNTLVTSFSSGTTANFNSLDTLSYSALNTASTPWPANAIGNYKWAYTVSSANTSVTDTIPFYVHPRMMAQDRGLWTNGFGSTDAKAVLARYEFKTNVEIDSVWVGISANTQVGATIEIAITDMTNFTGTTNPPSNVIGVSALHTVTQADITAGHIYLAVNEGPGTRRVVLAPAMYNFVATLNGGVSPTPRILLLNDISITQANGMSLMYSTSQNQWFSGFMGSNSCNALAIRPILCKSYLGVEEDALNSAVTVSPNPATEVLNIRFAELNGNYNITLTDMFGRVVAKDLVNIFGGGTHTINVADFAAGIYMLNINNGKASITQKIVVQ